MSISAPHAEPVRGEREIHRVFNWLCLPAGLAFLLLGFLDCINFTVDDVFISLRYAENLACGSGLVFNDGQRIEGFSNLLWTLLLAGLAKLGLSQRTSDLALLISAKALGAGLGLATFLAVQWLLPRMQSWPKSQDRSSFSGLVLLSLGASYSFTLWSVSGMETPLCALAITVAGGAYVLALERLEQGKDSRRLLCLGGTAFGLAALARPEPIFIWVLAMAALMFTVPTMTRRALA
ncbi:MAG: hypothetical protein A2W26_13780 [Acidobacteria bacterium RBG_16_64_8]|nr:MAG: hypothetical protein A2W26_13780 [Acidobacteria bacterium RBG_16_64_8]